MYKRSFYADGRNLYSTTPDEYIDSTYDAAGKLVKINQSEAFVETNRFFDGDGRETKSTARDTAQTNGETGVKYYIRSNALGGETLSEADATGRKLKTIVKAAGATLARQTIGYDASGNPTQTVEFEQWDASAMSYRRTLPAVVGTYDGISESGETDPTGTGVGLDGLDYKEANLPPERDYPLYQPRGFDDVAVNQNGSEVVCYENGYARSCATAYRNLENGSTAPIIPNRKGQPVVNFETYGYGRIFYARYKNTPDQEPTIDPITKEEIIHANTVLEEITFIFPVSWDARQQFNYSEGKETTDNSENKKDCNALNFGYLSKEGKERLTSLGINGKQWDALNNDQRLGLWNVTGTIADAGLSLEGWRVDWGNSDPTGAIRQDRTLFTTDAPAPTLLVSVVNSTSFSESINGHDKYSKSFRQNKTESSLQLSFLPSGKGVDADCESKILGMQITVR